MNGESAVHPEPDGGVHARSSARALNIAFLVGAALVCALSVQLVRAKQRNVALLQEIQTGTSVIGAPLIPPIPLTDSSGSRASLADVCATTGQALVVFTRDNCAECASAADWKRVIVRNPGLNLIYVYVNAAPHSLRSTGAPTFSTSRTAMMAIANIALTPAVIVTDRECRIYRGGIGTTATQSVLGALVGDRVQ